MIIMAMRAAWAGLHCWGQGYVRGELNVPSPGFELIEVTNAVSKSLPAWEFPAY